MSDFWTSSTWRGRRIAWRVMGDGPPVVLCHGTPWSSVVWESLAESLSATHRVHLWDMPGYGRSSKAPEHAVDVGVQGEALTDLVHEWGLTRPAVVAHDIGGAVALRAHLLHGMPMSSLVLCDVVTLRPWGSDFFRLVQEHGDVFARLPAALHRGLVEAYVHGAVIRPLPEGSLGRLTEPWLGDEGQRAFYRQIAQADAGLTDEVVERLDDLDVPTLVLWGQEDAWLPVEQARRLHSGIAGSTLRVLPGAGHLVQYDTPEPLCDAVVDWLAQRRASRRDGSAVS